MELEEGSLPVRNGASGAVKVADRSDEVEDVRFQGASVPSCTILISESCNV